MKVKLDIDTDKLKTAAKHPDLRANLCRDPRGELAKLGIHIDDELEGRIKKHLPKG